MTENSKKPIPVLVSGALGKMGSEVIKTINRTKDWALRSKKSKTNMTD